MRKKGKQGFDAKIMESVEEQESRRRTVLLIQYDRDILLVT